MTVCLDIGGTTIKAAAVDGDGRILPLATVPTPTGDFDAFAAAVSGAVAGGPRDGVVSIAVTGVIDPATGRIRCANIPCIDGRAFAADLGRRLGRRVVAANDADCFALAEARAGAGRGRRVVFGAILGTGVGGGLVVDGRLVTGEGGFAGEWGHGPVTARVAGDPPVAIPRFPCGCGLAGCVDTVGGARGLERLHRLGSGADRSSESIVDGWRAGEPAASRAVALWTELVAAPLALVVNVVGASIVPVGGGLSRAPDLIARLDEAVRASVLRPTGEPLVVPGAIAGEPGLIGAAFMAEAEGGP